MNAAIKALLPSLISAISKFSSAKSARGSRVQNLILVTVEETTNGR
jgi:hypothetical protein